MSKNKPVSAAVRAVFIDISKRTSKKGGSYHILDANIPGVGTGQSFVSEGVYDSLVSQGVKFGDPVTLVFTPVVSRGFLGMVLDSVEVQK